MEVILYEYSYPEMSISIKAYFKDNNLVIDGYDIGKKVEEIWGDSDYEYITTVKQEHLPALYTLLGVVANDQPALLNELQKRYNTLSCYSEIAELLAGNNIPSDEFRWA